MPRLKKIIYGKKYRKEGVKYHGRHGVELARGTGPGPKNVMMLLRGGEVAIVPSGNIRGTAVKGDFRQAVENFKDEIDREIIMAKRAIVRETFRRIVARSPIWTGAYVESHRVGISKTAGGRGISRAAIAPSPYGVIAPKLSPAQADALRNSVLAKRIPYISRAQLHDVITISNSAPHAPHVEYIGWKYSSAHQVYNLTAQEMKVLTTGKFKSEIRF